MAETASAELEGALRRSARDVVFPPPGRADLVDPARAAFVALYEAGLVERLETVAWRCPRCACGLGPGDVRPVTGETPVAVLRLQVDDPAGGPPATLAVEHAAVELLGAVTAVGVPPGYTVEGVPLAGRKAAVPVLDEPVPVVEDAAFAGPVLVTPGHDPGHWDVARRLGLPVTVLAEEASPFAAREGALERLAADSMLAAQRVRAEDATACAHCGTVASARLAPHWVLDEELGGPWCLDRELWDGVSLPVGWCAECAKPTVAVAAVDLGSCAICFGELRLEPGVLDPLFVVAAWVAETVRGDGAVFVGGGPQWLGVATALALRVEAAPVSVLGAGEADGATGGPPA